MTAACDALAAQLAEAKAALGRLMTGTQEESIQNGEKRITYRAGTEGSLRAYIADLQREINENCGGTYGRRRVIHFIPTDS